MVTDANPVLPMVALAGQRGYRLINSKYPPIALFDDIANEDEFHTLYELQALTNPRLKNDLGNIDYLPLAEIPFGIPGCSYAVGPFMHVNPQGSRFSDGSYGVLYIAEDLATALAEVSFHQQKYWRRVDGLKYDRLVLRGLTITFNAQPVSDALDLTASHPIYDPDSYVAARVWGLAMKQAGSAAIRYRSIRHSGSVCWGLFTPKGVTRVVQSAHYELIWDGKRISKTNRIVSLADGGKSPV